MDKWKRSAVIIAAGRGSRFSSPALKEGESKCVVPLPLGSKKTDAYITPITATMNACMSVGIYSFFVVVGYGKSSVIAECDRLIRIYGGDRIKITYVENEEWETTSRELSENLGISRALDAGADEIYLMDGDTLVKPEYLGRLVDVPQDALLVRSEEYITPKDDICYTKFGFISYVGMKPCDDGVYEKYVDCRVRKVMRDSIPSNPDFTSDSSVLRIISEDFVPVFIHPTEGIYDIDTEEDYEKIKSMLLNI